jgi:hypothetical protein
MRRGRIVGRRLVSIGGAMCNNQSRNRNLHFNNNVTAFSNGMLRERYGQLVITTLLSGDNP